MALTRYNPARDLMSFRDMVNRLFEDALVPISWPSWESGASFPVDIRETPDALVVRAALPGVKAEDVQVQVEDGQLSIRAEMHAEEERQERGYLMREIRRGTFARTIPLPVPVQADKAEARLEQGILELVLPKAEKAKAKSIKVVAK